ncbi:SdrD B-like domain-containing protein [Spirosoma agri]|uniref:SD-repeat containing protein B domain-containing protein n=1 Tax=Spirosoma agri TaxID=1987381 RepID=A0A6M0IG29_9BACT|nr:SdrD B-like domain-containing protein [Spirosoma agri]NEU66311.1 hypothetical protein [Spirosoma agri]
MPYTFTKRYKALFLFFFSLVSTWALGQVQVTTSVDKATADVGAPFTYILQIRCPNIVGTCNNVVITDPLPRSLEFNGASAPTGNVQSVTYNTGTHTVTVTMNPVLNGTTDDVQISVGFKKNTYTGTVAANTAYSGPGNTSPSNTVTTTATNGITPPDFSDAVYLTKATNGASYPGSGFAYRWGFGNKSNKTLTSLVIEDVFPASIRVDNFNDASFPNGSTTVSYQIYYKTNTNGTYQLWPGGPWNATNTNAHTVSSLGLSTGSYLTALKWEYGPIPGDGTYYADANSTNNLQLGNLFGQHTGATGDNVINCIRATGQLNATPIAISEACVSEILQTPRLVTYNNKSIQNLKSGYVTGDTLEFTIDYGNDSKSGLDIKNPIITDLLPPELELISYSVGNAFDSTPLGSTPPYFTPVYTKLDQYNNSAQTLLRWNFTGLTIPKRSDGSSSVLRITLKTRIRPGIPLGIYTNTATMAQDYVGPTFCHDLIDASDINGNGLTTDSLCIRSIPFNVVAPTGAGLESTKFVRGSLDTDYIRYPSSGNTVPGGIADYKLQIKNVGTIPLKDIVVIDILPFIGDKGVVDLSTRGTQWRPFLIGAVTTSAANVRVFYSTAQNPCRDELTPGIPSPCQAPNWSTTLPADPNTVQSMKFDFGATVLQPTDALTLSWAMRAPVDAPTNGEIAWNSFGYIATRTDNNSKLLATEPIKVGIKALPLVPAGYGNYVWRDVNGNGVQDEDPSQGINGVRVDIYRPTGDTPNVSADQLVNFTLTSSKNGNPGYYQFSNLSPGRYYAVFHKPIGSLTITQANVVTPDDSLDSDGTATIISGDTLAITAITTLPGSGFDYRWDQGFSPQGQTQACTITDLSVTPGGCDPATNTYVLRGTIGLVNAPAQSLTLTDGTRKTTIEIAAGQTTASFSLTGLTSGTGDHTATLTSGNCGTISKTYTAPVACSTTPICSLNATTTVGACSGVTNTYSATTIVTVTNPTEGILTISTDTQSQVFAVSAGQPATFTAVFSGLASDGASHNVVASLPGCTTLTSAYTAPAACVTVPVYSLSATATASSCDPATNLYSVTAVIGLTNSVAGTLTVSTGSQNLTFVVTNASSQTITAVFGNLNADGASHVITASQPGSASTSTTYVAPTSCSTAPVCSLSIARTTGSCDVSTGTYSTTAVIQLTNPAAGTLTVSDGVQTKTFAVGMTGSNSVTAVFTGLPADGSPRVLTASLPGCSTGTSAYSAPNCCSTTVCVPIVITRTKSR